MRRTEAERRAEVAGWRASGQSASAYAKAHGLAQTTLARWAREVDLRQLLLLRYLEPATWPGGAPRALRTILAVALVGGRVWPAAVAAAATLAAVATCPTGNIATQIGELTLARQQGIPN